MKSTTPRKASRKVPIIILILLLVMLAAGAIWWLFLKGSDSSSQSNNISQGNNTPEPIYSNLTGLEISDSTQNNSPTFCVQIPNGSTDGARPQVGLSHAGVVFEAIAETGITRFAAIFQNPNTGVIGPIRSLRPYYLAWDTPFDCTIVHDGGSDEALAAVGNGNYRNLDENFNYMWKEAYINGQYRYWNNVFTSPEKLLQFNQDHSYSSSQPKTFPRLKPDQVANSLTFHQPCPTPPTDEPVPAHCFEDVVPPDFAYTIRTTFTNLADYIINYHYDIETNTYKRSYEYGGEHLVYDCPAHTTDFANCALTQVSPSAVVVMRVQESTMADGYHEQIQTTGEGTAYIFQNGTVVTGRWKKISQDRQIVFTDQNGTEIAFTPGQLWIAAVPQFGSVSWE